MIIEESHICKICGYNFGEPLWIQNDPNWLICDCCGSESGIEDFSLESIIIARSKWMEGGHQWFNSKKRPQHWNLQQQLDSIPGKWK